MIFKIICGKAGGTGKTLLATSEIIYSLNRNKKTVCVDWNLNNPDLSNSLYFFDKIDAKRLTNGFLFKEVTVNNTQKRLKLFTPIEPRILDDKDFWKYMQELYNYVKDETICIVDTRVDLTRLQGLTSCMDTVLNSITRIEIYYIMGWKYEPEEIELLEKACVWLKENIPNVEIIWVWNVHEQTRPRKLFWKKIGRSIYGEYELKLKNADHWKTLSFNTLFKLMNKYKFYKIKGLKGDEIPELWEPLFNNLLSLVNENTVIYNWLLIPEKTNMVFSSDLNTIGRKGNIKTVQIAREKFYNYIKNFEMMRDRINKKKGEP